MNWELIFGKLSWDSLVFLGAYRDPSTSEYVAFGAGSVVIVGFVAVVLLLTIMRWWSPLWFKWLTSLDHKRIGIMYIVMAVIMFVRAIIEAGVIRSQQLSATDGAGYLSPDHFGQLFTTHGTIMIFFVAMPMITGFMNYVMPLQIGARDVAYPFMNAVSFMLTAAGAILVMASLVLGKFSTGGWTAYPPYTGIEYSPGVGVDYWIWAVTLGSIASTLSAINLTATVFKKRAPGMTLMEMPLFCWTTLCASMLTLFALAPLTVATAMLALDRYLGFHFFTNTDGGNMMNYANLFWLFGHPEVYILALPAYGIWSEVVPTFSAKRLYGYRSLVYATIGIALMSFLVWLHHYFTMGQSANVNVAFGVATMLISIPTGVKMYDWMLTMFRGRIRLTLPMMFHIYFLLIFVIGGMTGVLLANPTVDFQVHNTLFLVAHFHNMIIPGVLYGLFAGYIYWFPKAFGFRLDEPMGRKAFWCLAPGFIMAFFPLYVIGMMGATRRTVSWVEPSYFPYFAIAMVGVLLLLAGVGLLVVQLIVSCRNRDKLAVPLGDPWDGRTLEWSLPSPPPEYNFAVLPTITARDQFAEDKEAGLSYQTPKSYVDIEVPRNSICPPLIGIGALALTFALVWHIWWLAIVSFLWVWCVVIARSFVCEPMRIITAAELKADDKAFLNAVRATSGVNRDYELSPENKGKAAPDYMDTPSNSVSGMNGVSA